MIAVIKSWLNTLLSYLLGSRAGAAEVKQEAVEADNVVTQKIIAAQEDAPRDDDAILERLRAPKRTEL